jgi:hypothetical protein
MKIVFFGASITQQKTGYVHSFKELNPNHTIYQFGYGGMYITDAGICFIDEVIDIKPDYCFIDWFSPACYRPPEKIKDYLDVIVQKLLNINCHPIFLFFYRKNMDQGWFDMFDYLKKYSYNHGVNYIDLSKLDGGEQYLRDSIHTNDLGSKKYGEIINNKFHNMKFEDNKISPKSNKWSIVSSIDANVEAKKYIKLRSFGCSSIVGVLQKLGEYTEDVKCFNQNREFIISLKDRWSEVYERQTMKFNFDNFCGELVINIIENKKLVWEKLFYIGDKIQITEYL